MSTAVSVENLSHSYPSSRRGVPARTALQNVSLAVQQGEIFGLLGPNGGGKTTLFRILSTMLLPTQGRVRLFEKDVVTDPEAARKKIGVVFQNPSLDKKLTVRENLLHQGHLYGLHGKDLEERIDSSLGRLLSNANKSDLVEVLSGGMQRRVEIAKGLLHKPDMLIMDEPSTGLDPGARRDMWDYLLQLKKEGITILVTTHLMEEGEACDKLMILHRGQTVAMGTPAELKSNIGGDVITIQSRHPKELMGKMQSTFSKTKFVRPPSLVGETIRVEIREGHSFIPLLVEAFPGLVEAVNLGKPTLEDVFIRETGQTYSAEINS